ncbi:hypothetical protein M5689_019227 [Euphorbia peplus]|nr:hypothetical protein M5689_019227 [Euphorbia peplus]
MEEDRTLGQDSSDDSDEPQTNTSNKKKNVKARGPSKGMKHMPGVVKFIQWDKMNRPYGIWYKMFVNHIGFTTRSKVSILIDEWDNVPQRLKDTLWLDVKREFQIDENAVYKAKVLQKCCKAWTGHKSRLVTGWIECSRPMPKNKREPYEEYEQITKEDWDEFVKIHTTEEAKKKREKARYSQSHNLHPHRMGAKSYAEMTPVWREKGFLPPPPTPSMSSPVTPLDASAASDRTIAWILARSKLDEEGNMSVPNKETQRVKSKIDEWRKKQDEGEFVPSRLDDALNRSLEKRDRSGYVMGVGGGVAIKEAFGKGERRAVGEASAVEIERRVRQKLRDELKEELREELREELLAEMTSNMNVLFQEKFLTLAKQAGLPNQMVVETISMIAPQVPRSCQSRVANSLPTLEVNDKEPRSCRLALFMYDPKERVIVAEGMCYPQMRVDHNKSIPPENVRVSVDHYEEQYEHVPVPVPSNRIRKLYQAHGSFVQWPKELVDFSTDEEIPKEQSHKRNDEVTSLFNSYNEQSPRRNDEEIPKEQSRKRKDEEIPKEQSRRRNDEVTSHYNSYNV